MVEHSKVDIGALARFGEKTVAHTMPRYGRGAGSVAGEISVAPVGKVKTSEAQTFAAYYKGMVEALKYFLQDSPKGIEALGSGAVVMAANYKAGDLSQAKAMDDVNKAFADRPDRPSLATDKKVLAKIKVHIVAPPEPKATSPSPTYAYDPPTATQQVDEHNRRYGHYEHWQPGMGYPRPGA